MSLLSDAEKAEFSAEIVKVAETFERDIVIYKEAQKIIVSTDVNWNPFQQNDLNLIPQNPENQAQVYNMRARIWYERQQPNPYLEPYVGGNLDEAQLKLKNPEGKVRIKIGPSGWAIMGGAKLIQFDGFMFDVESSPRAHGLFDNQYYTFWLKRTS
jgi:hypothetical protein